MRQRDWAGEGRALDGRPGVTGQGRETGDLRQRLDRLSAGHPSSPQYEAQSAYGQSEYGDAPDYDELEYAELPDGEELSGEAELPGDGEPLESAETGEDADRAAQDPERRDGRPAGRPGPARPAGWPAGDAGGRLSSGATAGLAGRREPYRPWFTAGQSPEPWFTADPGG